MRPRRHLPYRHHVHRSLVALLCMTGVPACQAHPPGAAAPVAANAQNEPASSESVAELDKCIFVVLQAGDGTFWFGSDGQGVYHVDGKSIIHYTAKHGLRGNRVRAIQQDRSGNILVASDGGLSRFDGRAFRPLEPVNTDPTKGEWRLDPGDLWFAGWQDEGIVYRYDGTSLHRLAFPKTEAGEAHIARYPRSRFPAMAYNPYDVYAVFRDSRGHLWFGTCTLGACRYDGKTFAWASKSDLDFGDDDSFCIRSIAEDKDGRFWFTKTLHRFEIAPAAPDQRGTTALGYRKHAGLVAAQGDPAKSGFTHFMSSVTDKNGDLWMATIDGDVWRYDGARLTRYPIRSGNARVSLYSISKDRQDRLWLGTHEHGVYRFNGTTFEKFTPGS